MSAVPTPEPYAPLVRVDVDDAIATITLDSARNFNALSTAMLDALQAAIERVAADRTARVVVIKAEGKAFSAGHDMREMHGMSREQHADLFARCTKMMLSLQKMPQPVIARVHAMATAAGCQLVAACDLAVAASNAQFAVSGVNYGIFCGTPSVPLARNVPRKMAFEMLVTGEFIDAHTALARGLVNRVVEPDRLDDVIAQLAASIKAKSPDVIAAGKAMFYAQVEMGQAAAYQLAGEGMVCNLQTAPGREGMTAFTEKRKPVF